VDGDVQRRQPILEDTAYVSRLQIGERGEIPVTKRQPVIVVPDVERIPEARGQTVHEAEIAAIGTPADGRRLQLHAHRKPFGPLDVELHQLAVRLPH
jgi:hypothetical protein